jgi:hypothetical protein
MLYANLYCLNEGAQLFYPTDRSEVDDVFAMIKNTNVKSLVVGILDVFDEGVKTVDG